jgi:MoaA/NifB/PqqE/SkfB family radical SAM enzyme
MKKQAEELITSARPRRSIEQNNRNYLKENKPHVYKKILQSKDKINRGESIPIIQFQYNYLCNFTCEHCSIEPFQTTKKQRTEREGWNVDKVRDLSRQADEMGLFRFVITGGEPLIFRDIDQLIKAIDPQKHYINIDTNGWFLDYERAKHLKNLGVDRIQLSIDSLDAESHDAFRQKKNSHERCLRAIDAVHDAGLQLFVQTVVTKSRVRSQELIDFIEYMNERNAAVFITFAKQVGEWQGKEEILVDKDDMRYIDKLEKKYNLFTHISPSYDFNMRCIATKGIISVTQFGDVLPCPYIHTSIGNVFKEPLKDVIQRGLDIKWFGEWKETCLIAEDKEFISEFVDKKIDGKELPVPCEEVFTYKDKTREELRYHKNPRLHKEEDLFVNPTYV